MKPVREITAREENLRFAPSGIPGHLMSKRDGIEPVPVGTIILKAFRVVGYDADVDGSLMARLENIDKDGIGSGWEQNCIGLYPDSTLETTLTELEELFNQ